MGHTGPVTGTLHLYLFTYVKHSLQTQEFGVPFSSRLEKVQTGTGVHPSSSPLGTAGFISGVKTCGAWSWLLTAEGKSEWSHNSTLPGTFVAYTGRTLSSHRYKSLPDVLVQWLELLLHAEIRVMMTKLTKMIKLTKGFVLIIDVWVWEPFLIYFITLKSSFSERKGQRRT